MIDLRSIGIFLDQIKIWIVTAKYYIIETDYKDL
jgi:hypothetical protein